MDLHLISLRTCPYVQRAVIALLHKKVPHRITHIDVDDPPPWFLELSPLGKVPVLVVDDATVLFESAVISEFVDEITPGRLLPEDPLARARSRAWIEFGSACLVQLHDILMAKTARQYEDRLEELMDRFEWLEQAVSDGPFFAGESFSLVDATYAPLFVRLQIVGKRHPLYPPESYPRIARWSEELRTLSVVERSMVAGFEESLLGRISDWGGHVAGMLGPEA